MKHQDHFDQWPCDHGLFLFNLLKQFHKAPANQKASKQIKRHQSKVCGCWKSGVTATFARRLLKATKP
jgi:hypothetical protein